MGLGKIIKGEFIDVIEWLDNSTDTLVYKFPDEDKAIKNGAQLTVRESQAAVLVNEGVIADVYGPGRHELSTNNMPILTKLKSWKYGFESPFKVDVFFVSTKQFVNEKYGTSNPVPMRDKEFGMVRIRAFGIYSFKVDDAGTFLKEVFGTCASYSTIDITGHLRNAIVSRLSDALAESGIPLLDMASQYNELSESAKQSFAPIFEEFGLALTSFYVQNVSVPEEVEKMMDAKTQMGIIGDMQQYAQFQTAQAIKDAANNESGGLAGAGVGMGAGAAMGNMMAGMFNNNASSGAQNNQAAQTAMAACPSCGKQINAGAKFCPECGAKVGTNFCSECGAANKAGAKFCSECGTKF